MATEEGPFADLPAALLEEMLERTSTVGSILLDTFNQLKRDRAARRQTMLDRRLIFHEGTLGYPPFPTTCAADGSYAIERLLTVDLAAGAAVAVEGLAPPSEKRYWAEPRHSTFVAAEVHHEGTVTILRALMLGMELLLAVEAPHDLVMIDGPLNLPVIFFDQALRAASEAPELLCSREFMSRCCEYLEAYRSILRAERSDRNYVGVPKYSTGREISDALRWSSQHDDRGLLTLLLQPGEVTLPARARAPRRKWYLNTDQLPDGMRSPVKALADDIAYHLKRVFILYYKPHQWLPALRIEMGHDIANNKHRLASVIQGIKHQCATSAMLEPYPLYLADRTVKALAKAVPAFRQVTTQRVSESYEGDIGEIFFAMHGYRSESGSSV